MRGRGERASVATSAAAWVLAAMSLLAVAIPAGVFFRLRFATPDVARQHDPPDVEVSATLLAAARESPDPGRPVILSYHDVRSADERDRGDVYTVTPERFAEHMATLEAAGYRTGTSGALAAYLDGRPLPPKTVFLTFDDGTSGLWRHVDRILDRHGFTASTFVITSRLGTHRPYYLSWDELERMAGNGRWDVESHTRRGHDRIPVDGEGGDGPFLINRRWIAGGGRLESLADFGERVRTDLVGSVRDLVREGVRRPRFFAFPFSAETNPTNDPAVPPLVGDIVDRTFEAAMTNVEPDRLVSERDRARRSLPRLEVFAYTTAEDLLTRIAGAAPIPPDATEPLRHPALWTDSAGRPYVPRPPRERLTEVAAAPQRDLVTVGGGELSLAPPEGRYVGAHYAMGRTADWQSYRVSATLRGLRPAGAGPSASVIALAGSPAQTQVSVSATFVRVTVGGEVAAERRLREADVRTVAVEVTEGRVVVSVDGLRVHAGALPVGAVNRGGIAVGAIGGAEPGAPVRFTALDVTDRA